MNLMDEVCAVEEQTRSGITRKAIKSYLRAIKFEEKTPYASPYLLQNIFYDIIL